MNIVFETSVRERWLQTIISSINDSERWDKREDIKLDFNEAVEISQLEPIHIVTYACLIQYLFDHGKVKVCQGENNKTVSKYIYEELGLRYYWRGSNHENTKDEKILNLWRVVASEADTYAHQVTDYFKTRYFENKDLSPIQLSLVESFYNISDHAQAGDNAFSLVMYDDSKHLLRVAISDMGRGVVNTVRNFDPTVKDDKAALLRAIDEKFTISSTPHNKGKGLSNILSNTDEVHIFSGTALLLKRYDTITTYDVSFSFPGTLIYFEIELSSLDEIDYISDFSFD